MSSAQKMMVFSQIKHVSPTINLYMSILESSLKTQSSWHSISFRMPFQEQQMPTPLVMKKAVILQCCQTGIFRLCSHMWHILQNSAYWEDFLEPTFWLSTHPVKWKLIRSVKWYMAYKGCGEGPLTLIPPQKTTVLLNHPKSLTPIHKNAYPFTKKSHHSDSCAVLKL